MLGAVRTTLRYAKRNGARAAVDAVRERLWERRHLHYTYEPPTAEELAEQRGKRYQRPLRFSILVPAYETPEVFLQDLLLSVAEQSYTDYELILADASESDAVQAVVQSFQEQYPQIIYFRIDNQGISENTNAALERATGDYVALLDHDDLLTPDALYRLREAIDRATESAGAPYLVYSDEDKCSSELERYYEPNRKKDYDPEMLLTNNYICHLSVYRADLLRRLRLRSAYDGSQDYDLLLRACALAETEGGGRKRIVHVPRVLYHWRCHEGSTAVNPGAKDYAYEAGRRAIEEALRQRGIEAAVSDTRHHGFYHIDYGDAIFTLRPEIGVVGGPVYEGGRMRGGLLDAKGEPVFDGLPEGFSGEMHRADLQQEAVAVDLRNIRIREDLLPLYREITGCGYPYRAGQEDGALLRAKSLSFCNKVRARGITILYDPQQGGL